MSEIGLYSANLNAELALEMAQLCREAYTSKKDCVNKEPDCNAILNSLKQRDNDLNRKRKYESVEGVGRNSAQAIFVEHEDFVCMAFRGTDERADWLDNIDGRPANSEQAMFGDFHRGFYRSCDDVWSDLDNWYKNARKNDKDSKRPSRPLFLTGHSLGGAMATVGAAKLVLEDRPFAAVYTYGQPRVVKRETAQFLNQECKNKYYRFQNNEDIVTRVPSRLMGYSHVGQCLYIDTEGAVQTDTGFWYRFLDFFEGAFDTLVDIIEKEKNIKVILGSLIKDHDLDQYIQKIENWDYRGAGKPGTEAKLLK